MDYFLSTPKLGMGSFKAFYCNGKKFKFSVSGDLNRLAGILL